MSPLLAVYPSRRYLSAKLRTFLDFLGASTKRDSQAAAQARYANASGDNQGYRSRDD